jgi:hypothetical protein
MEAGVAEEARTRGFATPAFAGCAFAGTDVAAGRATLHAGTGLVNQQLKKPKSFL